MTQLISKFIRNQKGISLVEMSITIGIMGIVLSVATILIVMNTQTIKIVHNRSNARIDTRNAMRALRGDLQKISGDSLISYQKDKLTFYDVNGHYVKYQMVGSTLQRNNIDLLKNLTTDPFQYLDTKGHKYKADTALAFIEITLKIEKMNQKYELEDRLYVRN